MKQFQMMLLLPNLKSKSRKNENDYHVKKFFSFLQDMQKFNVFIIAFSHFNVASEMMSGFSLKFRNFCLKVKNFLKRNTLYKIFFRIS